MIPVLLGSGGVAGWNILKRTASAQLKMVREDPVVARTTTYVRDNIAKATTPDALVSDYRLLSAALGAFGLEADIANKAFIRKILESDLTDDKSLVNRLSDKRYLRLAQAFRYDRGDGTVSGTGFGDQLGVQYVEREFERRVGEGDQDLRIALNARRELAGLANRASSDNTLWYEVLGNPPLRRMFEVGFGFDPKSFGQLPVDRQHAELKGKAEKMFGSDSFAIFRNPESVDKLIKTFLVRAQGNQTSAAATGYSNALTLLSNIRM